MPSYPAYAGDPVRCSLTVQSLLPRILGHPPSRVTTTECAFAFSRLKSPRFCLDLIPQTEGAGNAGCLLHPRSRVQCVEECAHEHTGTAGALRHSLRNGFTAYAALSPETNSSCLRRCRLDGSSIRLDQIRHRQLGTSHGCRDHTVLPYAIAPFILRAVSRSRV